MLVRSQHKSLLHDSENLDTNMVSDKTLQHRHPGTYYNTNVQRIRTIQAKVSIELDQTDSVQSRH